jgi:hypothetical protein
MIAGDEPGSEPIDPTIQVRLNDMRQAGRSCGAQEATKAIIALGDRVTRDQANVWINRVIDQRCDALWGIGASNTETEAWQLTCRMTFLAKIRRVLLD